MAESQKATVGRIVHFYNTALAETREFNGVNLNGQGAGPYPALVIQDFNSGPYVNLVVHAYGGDWREGSVSEKNDTNTSRYWVWPPRV